MLDEIEKAHPDIFNILLQVMDHGTLTDNNGRKADFRNVIIIMTTNAGADVLSKGSIGFTESKQAGDEMESIKRMFTPEFRNRLDATISFASLDHDVILRVVDKFLLELEAQLHEKKVEASFTPALKEFLAKKGFDPQMGARPMARLIQDTIRKALADELLFGRLVSGGKVTIGIDAGREDQARVRRSQRGRAGRLSQSAQVADKNGSLRAPVLFRGLDGGSSRDRAPYCDVAVRLSLSGRRWDEDRRARRVVTIVLAVRLLRGARRRSWRPAATSPPIARTVTAPMGEAVGVMPALAGRPTRRARRCIVREFRDGKRPSTVMQQLAKGYTDAQIEAAAAYLAAQKP